MSTSFLIFFIKGMIFLIINNSKEFIDYICYKYRTTQTEIIKRYNQQYNTSIQQQNFNRTINNNNLKLDMVINICNLYNCTLDVKEK